MNRAPGGHPAYLFLLRQWGGPLAALVEVKPDPHGVACRIAANPFTWYPSQPKPANDPCRP